MGLGPSVNAGVNWQETRHTSEGDETMKRSELRNLQAQLATMTLAEMNTYYKGRVAAAQTERERAHAQRMLEKVQESIGVTLGLKRRSVA